MNVWCSSLSYNHHRLYMNHYRKLQNFFSMKKPMIWRVAWN